MCLPRVLHYSLIGNGRLQYHQPTKRPQNSRAPDGRLARVACTGRIILYLFICTQVTGCERSATDASKRSLVRHGLRISLLGPATEHPQWPGICGGARRYMAGTPTVHVECFTPPDRTAESRRDTVAEILATRPHAICLFVSEHDALHPGQLRNTIDLIARQDMLLVTIGTDYQDQRVYGHVGTDWPRGAGHLAENLRQIAAGRKSYLLLHEDGLSPLATSCYRYFSGVVKHQDDITLLQKRNAAEGDRSSAELVEEMLALFPHAGIVVTLDPGVWLNAAPEWDEHLRQFNRHFRFATLSTAPQLWSQVGTPAAPGEAAALVGPLDGDIGYAAVAMVVRAMLSEREASPRQLIPCEIVTPDTLLDFARRYAEAAGGMDVSPYLRGSLPAASQPDGQ